ncbi:hypothetical protein Tco_1456141 [Tanacetum coccineum]
MNQNVTSVNTKLSKPSTLGTKFYSVTPLTKSKVIPKAVEKNDLSKLVTSYLTPNKIIKKCTKVLAPGFLKIETEPINAYFKNNRVVHHDYLNVTKEHVATLQELLDQARALKPLDEHIGYASKFVERIQEVLVYVSASCPFTQNCNANVKNVSFSKNSDNICLSCNECLFSENHDACVVQYLKKMQKRKVAKSAKQKEKKQWKPTDSGCSKHMTGHRNKLINFVSMFIDTIRFGNDHFEAIMGYGDLQMRNILILHVYYVEGLGHDLFSIGEFCDSDLKVAFRKDTCFVRNLEGVDLLSGSRGSNIYIISMADMMKSSPVCLLSKSSKTKS